MPLTSKKNQAWKLYELRNYSAQAHSEAIRARNRKEWTAIKGLVRYSCNCSMQRGFGLYLTIFKTCGEMLRFSNSVTDEHRSVWKLHIPWWPLIITAPFSLDGRMATCLHQDRDVTVTPSVEIRHAAKIMEGPDRREARCCRAARVPHNKEVLGLNLLVSGGLFSLFLFACGLPLTVQSALVVITCDSKSAAGVDVSVNACLCVLALWLATCPGCTSAGIDSTSPEDPELDIGWENRLTEVKWMLQSNSKADGTLQRKGGLAEIKAST